MEHSTKQLTPPLTDKELHVIKLLSWGAIKKEIAKRLGVSVHKVVRITRNAYTKLGINSLGQACAWYFTSTYNIPAKHNPLLTVLLFLLFSINEGNFKRPVTRLAKTKYRIEKITYKISSL